MIEHALGAQVRVEAELLRQVAENLSDVVRLREHVDVAEADGARVGLLQRGDGPHQRRLACAVGPEQPEHAGGDLERDVV